MITEFAKYDVDLRNYSRMFFKYETRIIFIEDIQSFDNMYNIVGTTYNIYQNNVDDIWLDKNDTYDGFIEFFEIYERLNSKELFEKYPDDTMKLYDYVMNEMNIIEKEVKELDDHAWYEKLELIKIQLDMTDVDIYFNANKYNI